MARKAHLKVTEKYIVNEGMPNEMFCDYVGEAFWVRDDSGKDLEYHIAKWKEKCGVIDERGGIAALLDCADNLPQILCVNDYAVYMAMTNTSEHGGVVTHIFRTADWSVCLAFNGKPTLSIVENYNKVPYILAYSYQGMSATTIYDLKMNTRPGWEYIGTKNVIKNMYSIVIDKPAYSWDRGTYSILSANGDAYQIGNRLGIKAYDGGFSKKDILPASRYTASTTFFWRLISAERYSIRNNEVNVSSQNTFLLRCESYDCGATEDSTYRNYILVLIPTDVKNCNYQLADCLIDEFDKSKSDLTSKEIEQYIIW